MSSAPKSAQVSSAAAAALRTEGTREYVSIIVASQTFGVAVDRIQDVFALQALTPVPLSRPEIAGVLNLRGRIVTAIDARARLGMPPRPEGFKGVMAVGVEYNGEAFGLIVDRVGEVLRLPVAEHETNPVNLNATWAAVSEGVHRLQGQLLVLLDIEKMLELGGDQAVAA